MIKRESEAIVLAIELKAGLILIDELDGRLRAKQEGLPILGVLGVLVLDVLAEAKHQGLIRRLAPLLEDLQQKYRFFISKQLAGEVRRRSGE